MDEEHPAFQAASKELEPMGGEFAWILFEKSRAPKKSFESAAKPTLALPPPSNSGDKPESLPPGDFTLGPTT